MGFTLPVRCLCPKKWGLVAVIRFGVLIVLLTSAPATSHDEWASFMSSGPYCGLYSMYAALRMHGADVTPQDVLKAEYVGSAEGSSFAELIRLAADCGFQAVAAQNLTLDMLDQTDASAILHVKSSIKSRTMNHYVLYTGSNGDYCQIYNPPNAPRQVLRSELAQHWYGTAVLVSPDPIDLSGLAWWRRGRIISVLLIVMTGVAALSMLCTQLGRKVQLTTAWGSEFVLLVLLGIGLAIGYNRFSRDGLLRASASPQLTENALLESFISRITFDELKQKYARGEIVLVDARWAADYAVGHIDGALNIEPNAGVDVYEALRDGLARDKEIVVYCQSAGCPYASVAVQKFQSVGHEKVRYFKGGWNEWRHAK